jgi:hypothetical protein
MSFTSTLRVAILISISLARVEILEVPTHFNHLPDVLLEIVFVRPVEHAVGQVPAPAQTGASATAARRLDGSIRRSCSESASQPASARILHLSTFWETS